MKRPALLASPDKVANMLLGALHGGILVTGLRGLVLGWQAYQLEWGWLSLLFGLFMGPIFLMTDLLTLRAFDGAPWLILPWSAGGALLGALIGYLLPAKSQPGAES